MKHWINNDPELWLPTWDLVIKNLNESNEEDLYYLDKLGVVMHEVCIPEYQPITALADLLSSEYNNALVSTHTYISFTKHSKTFGKHVDDLDVYLLQAIGTMKATVWEEEVQYDYNMMPGDLLHIPAGLYHSTEPLSSRVSISYGVEL